MATVTSPVTTDVPLVVRFCSRVSVPVWDVRAESVKATSPVTVVCPFAAIVLFSAVTSAAAFSV